ncbi:RNA polymerase factor sigma-54 [Actibacterium sp.]|uniref:RNA polymerase factor sigma-54 n=1 Tax=Actibacterium sp. TaxID=1872125 RepID=UPI00356AAEC4
MAVRPALSATQTQRLSLTPGLRQGMSLLQLSTAELWAEITRQTTENPLLDFADNSATSLPDFNTATRNISQAESLSQSLIRQVSLMDLPKPVALLAQYLAVDLTDEGYLEQSDDEISELLGMSLTQVEQAVRALQSCEPVGIAARNLAECLALQLAEKGVPAQAAHLACNYLDLLVEQQWTRASRNTGLSPEALQDIAVLLPGLNPHPGQVYSAPAAPLIPEIEVELDRAGMLNVTLIGDVLPRLHLDEVLMAQMSRDAALAQQYRGPAQTLINGLKFRNDTLRRVAVALVARQAGFFTKGPDFMAPLTRSDLAQDLGLHPSTVGRTISSKALIFQGITYPLSRFISSSVRGGEKGPVSAFTVQRSIRRLVEHEPADAPHSDSEIAALLRREGVDIARRTVAKYRGCMNIPSSFERGRLNAMRRNRPAPPGSGSPD